MRNERGLTLVELLAVLVILGVIMTLLGSVLVNGMKASDRSATNQRLQQEANYIAEAIRKEYLELDNTNKIRLTIDNDNRILKLDEKTISEGYIYCFKAVDECVHEVVINRDENQDLIMELKKEDSLPYKIETTLSKLR